jgi:hypothetical protein
VLVQERVLERVLERELVLVQEQVLVQERVLVPVPEQGRAPERGLHKQPGCLPASLLILMQILVSCSNHPPCLNFDCETVERWRFMKAVTSFHTR